MAAVSGRMSLRVPLDRCPARSARDPLRMARRDAALLCSAAVRVAADSCSASVLYHTAPALICWERRGAVHWVLSRGVENRRVAQMR